MSEFSRAKVVTDMASLRALFAHRDFRPSENLAWRGAGAALVPILGVVILSGKRKRAQFGVYSSFCEERYNFGMVPIRFDYFWINGFPFSQKDIRRCPGGRTGIGSGQIHGFRVVGNVKFRAVGM